MKTLIIDDEPHARRYLRELLGDEVEIVGEAANGRDGLQKIHELSPELVFLDIQMPGMDGFAVVEQASGPVFVFVTAFSEFAAKAFEVEAVDYLCKPFDKERLSIALERATRRRSPADNGHRERVSRLMIKEEEGIVFLPVEEVLWIEAANKYLVIHCAGRTHILRQTLQSLEASLDPGQFLRIHRSTLVNKAAVRGLHPLFQGDYVVKLTDGTEVTLSRNFRASFFERMSR